MMQARSSVQFPSLAPPSCDFHGREGRRCTPMDCEFYRTAPQRWPAQVNVPSTKPVLTQNSVPIKRKGRRK